VCRNRVKIYKERKIHLREGVTKFLSLGVRKTAVRVIEGSALSNNKEAQHLSGVWGVSANHPPAPAAPRSNKQTPGAAAEMHFSPLKSFRTASEIHH
jgi:hypothetical protein